MAGYSKLTKGTQSKVSAKISKLRHEGMSEDQAVAVAMSMGREGRLGPKGRYKPVPKGKPTKKG